MPSIGPDKLPPVRQVREGYGRGLSPSGRCTIDTVAEEGRSVGIRRSTLGYLIVWPERVKLLVHGVFRRGLEVFRPAKVHKFLVPRASGKQAKVARRKSA